MKGFRVARTHRRQDENSAFTTTEYNDNLEGGIDVIYPKTLNFELEPLSHKNEIMIILHFDSQFSGQNYEDIASLIKSKAPVLKEVTEIVIKSTQKPWMENDYVVIQVSFKDRVKSEPIDVPIAPINGADKSEADDKSTCTYLTLNFDH